MYIADYGNHRIRKVTVLTGIISTIAGTGDADFSGDGGAATSAKLNNPTGVVLDSSGRPIEFTFLLSVTLYYSVDNVYIADLNNDHIRKVTATTGVITSIAGSVSGSYGGDGGAATSASLYGPTGIAIDTSGNLYISDQFNDRIRKIAVSTNIITTIAGTGMNGFSGDGGAATSASIQRPIGVSLDSSSNVYFGDYGGYNVIRKITVSTGIITTVAGTGSPTGGYNGDNIQATAATFNSPTDVIVDSVGNLYICDNLNNRVRKVTISTGLIETVVGNGTAASAGDGLAATSAAVKSPVFSRFDSAGNLYISENTGSRVRKVITVSSDAPTMEPRYDSIYYFQFSSLQ